MILLDTQALVWLMEGSSRLGSQARQVEAESEIVAISAISLWEIGLLVSRNKLALPVSIDRWVDMVEHEAAIEILPVTRVVAVNAGMLPEYEHGDPGDRIVLATARNSACPVMTSDRRMLAYAASGHIQAIDARR